MRTVRMEVPFTMTAEKVWTALSDPSQRAAWFGGTYEIEPRHGGSVRIDTEDMHGGGVVTSYGPPHVIEHTFVDDAAPDVSSVCRWGITRTVDGALLTFQHAGSPSRPWSTALRTPLLQQVRRVLLVSYLTEETPRALLEAGIEVLVKSGPAPDQWSVAHLAEPTLRFEPRTEPLPVDLVHLDVTGLFDEYLDVAVELGASVYWVHDADSPPPEDVSSEWRAETEARGLTYVDDALLVDAARRISRG